MALYHFTAKAVSRGKGQSAVHTAAYNAREQLHDDREKRDTKDYGSKGKPEFSGIFAPKDAPEWVHDRAQLWNRAEAAENRKDSQTARNVEFALPHELNAEQRKRLVTDFCRETFARRGMVADVHIHVPHDKNDTRNYHVHCLLTMRRLDGENFASKKETDWNKKAELEQWREKWAQMGARALERAGHQQEADRFRHGHQTLAKQREAALERGDHEWAQHCDREAQIHKGAAVSAMEQRNDPRLADNEIARESKAIDDRNAARAEIRDAEKELAAAQKEEQRQREPEKPQKPEAERVPPKTERWHDRPATEMEEKIFRMQDAAERNGTSLSAALWKEGIQLARVDQAGIAQKNAEYMREFEQQRLEVSDGGARLRRTQVQEGELVAVTKSGDVFRLNPKFLELDKLEYAVTGGVSPSLSDTLAYFVEKGKTPWESRYFGERMEDKLNGIYAEAKREGKEFSAALGEWGIALAVADERGKAMKDEQYRHQFDFDRVKGDPDARLRKTYFKAGELVAVTQTGHVFKLDTRLLHDDICKQDVTQSLSATLDHFQQDRKQQREDRNAWLSMGYETREAIRQQRNFAYNVRQGVGDAVRGVAGVAMLEVVNAKGIADSLGSFVENLLGMGTPKQTNPQQAQQRALEALERIEESMERGDRLTASDVANLLPEQLLNLHRHGDNYMREMISDLQKSREEEYERQHERERGR